MCVFVCVMTVFLFQMVYYEVGLWCVYLCVMAVSLFQAVYYEVGLMVCV